MASTQRRRGCCKGQGSLLGGSRKAGSHAERWLWFCIYPAGVDPPALRMQTPMSKAGEGEAAAAGELPSRPQHLVVTGLWLPSGVVCRGRAAGVVSTEAVGNISRETSYRAGAPGLYRSLMCLALALGGEKPSSNAAVVQGGPVAWLWLVAQ